MQYLSKYANQKILNCVKNFTNIPIWNQYKYIPFESNWFFFLQDPLSPTGYCAIFIRTCLTTAEIKEIPVLFKLILISYPSNAFYSIDNHNSFRCVLYVVILSVFFRVSSKVWSNRNPVHIPLGFWLGLLMLFNMQHKNKTEMF